MVDVLKSIVIAATFILLGSDALRLFNFPVWEANTICGYVRAKRYPCEHHKVTTPDGYILSLHRIPRGASHSNNTRRPPVILTHGLGDSVMSYLIGPPSKALGHMLPDAGFDLWLFSQRGTPHSRRHVQMSPEEPEFWQYGLDEMSTFDIPAVMDYVLDRTGQQKVGFVAHSVGGILLYTSLSGRPEYNSKVFLGIMMASPAAPVHTGAPAFQLLPPVSVLNDLSNMLTILGITYVGFPFPELHQMVQSFCLMNRYTKVICFTVLELIFGFDMDEVDTEKFEEALSYIPSGFSFRTFLQIIQWRESGVVRKYDFGPEENLRRYNSASPPLYNLRNITAPVAMFWGLNDWVAHPKDVQTLADQLPNLVGSFQVKWPHFTHGDFVLARNVASLVYEDVVKLFRQYSEIDFYQVW